MINSRSKGKRGELEVASLLRKHGYESAKRTFGQSRGGHECPDVECDELAYWIEVKRGNLNPAIAYERAEQDALLGGDVREPLVFSRRDNEAWLVTVDATTFLELLQAADALQKLKAATQHSLAQASN